MAQIDGGEEKRRRLKAFISIVFKKTPSKTTQRFSPVDHKCGNNWKQYKSTAISMTWYLKKKVK